MFIKKELNMTLLKEGQPDLYSCNPDEEYLQYDEVDTAVEAYLDDIGFDSFGKPNFPKTLTVYGWARKTVEPDFLKDSILEFVTERLDEEYGGEDASEITVKMQEAEAQFIAVILKEYTPWQCEHVSEEEINVQDWINENRPDWLEGE